uniref:VPS9 domain containing 1 n=1 Tax=Oryctolagus cuniculus TaxID=9986 RepID=A0A5F9DIT4_RABIT
MLKLAEQCLERAQSTAAKLGKTHLKPATPVAVPGPCPASRHRRVCSDEGGKLSPFLPPEIFQRLQVVEAHSSKRELTPLEEASLQNQKLKASYEARMARLDPSQAMQKTSLTLSLQRQMMENLVIARAREETLQRKMEERRLRLQEAANRRFCSQVALTPEEREQRALFAAILEYEQDHDWPKHWRAKLKRSPGDLSLVTSLVSHLLRYPSPQSLSASLGLRTLLPSNMERCLWSAGGPGPQGEGAGQLQATQEGPEGGGLEDKLGEDWAEPLTMSRRQDPLTLLALLPADRLLSLTLLAFESLNTAACKDRCLACIEEPFFSPLWPLLLALYRSVHRGREVALSRSMELYRNAPPTAVGVPPKLLPRDPQAKGAAAYPYCTAAQELGLLVLESCPQKKLECIGEEVGRQVWGGRPHPTVKAKASRGPSPAAAIAARSGADDLLPILSFVVLRSGLPQLVSECAALEEFIHEGYLIGEEGYCLTSLQSALSYVELLPQGPLGK